MKLFKASKFIVSAVLVVATLLCSAALPLQASVVKPQMSGLAEEEAVSELKGDPSQEAAVRAYWDAVDRNDWEAWVECYAPSVRQNHQALISDPQNHADGRGILAIKHAQIISMERVDDGFAPTFYKELADFYEKKDFACYLVEINTTVDHANDFFSTGKSRHICIVVKQDDSWYMGAIYAYTNEYEDAMRGIKWGFIDFVTQPSTITMLPVGEGAKSRTVSFTEAVVNVTCNEIGAMGYKKDAVYANVMAVKMLCWWARAGHYHEDDGYDIGDPEATYMLPLATNDSETQVIRNAVSDLKAYYMVTSKGKLFYADYHASESYGKGSGTLSQNGSNRLAKNGYSWQEILHYYYDNSKANSESSVGIIKIGHECKYAKSSTYSSNTTQHWFACTICGTKFNAANHSWVVYSVYHRCSVCGRIKYLTADFIRDSSNYVAM